MLERFTTWIGYGLCHQLPERSFFGGGLQVPVCARDTGIYVGFMLSLVVLAILHRGKRPSGMPTPATWVVALVLVAFMAWDGITSYAGLRVTTNALRLLTGLATGYAVTVFLIPLLNEELWRSPSPDRILSSPRALIAWTATIPLAFLLVWFGAPVLGAWYAVLVAVAIVAALSAINLVIVAMLPWFDRRAVRWRDLLKPTIIAVGLSFIEIAASAVFRSALEATTRAISS